MKLRLVYAGYNFFSSALQALLERTDVEVVLCLTGEPSEHVSNVVKLAAEHGIPVHHGRIRDDTIELIQGLSTSVIFCAAYSYRIPVTRLGVKYNFNLHPSLLPEGRGPNPLPYLVAGRSELSALTIHEMIEEFDRGSILTQEPVPVQEGWGFDELAMAMYLRAPGLVHKTFNNLDYYFLNRNPQDAGSYWPLNDDDDRRVDWSETTEVIKNKSKRFGALGILCPIDRQEYEISAPITYIRMDHAYPPGQVILYGKGFWYVAAADGLVRLIQPAS